MPIAGAAAGGSDASSRSPEKETTISKLSDTQTVLLSAASQRANLSYGLFVADAGLAAIGVEPEQGQGQSRFPPVEQVQPVTEPRVTKMTLVLSLFQRTDGATLPELIAATGWLPHTTRAALTGLRKRATRLSAASATMRPATTRGGSLMRSLEEQLAAFDRLSSAELNDQ